MRWAELTGVWYREAAFSSGASEVRCSLVAADPLTVALGRPNREQVMTCRAATATTLQALELTNGATLANLLERAADCGLCEGPHSSQDLINFLYERAFGRFPTAAEKEMAMSLVESANSQGRGGGSVMVAWQCCPSFNSFTENGPYMKTPSNLTRRDFIKTASAATLSALAAGFPRRVLAAEAEAEPPKATADTVIVLWMGGGMAHTETFDPKRYTPFEKGMEPERVPQHLPEHRHGGGQHQVFAGPGETGEGDGSRHA